ncbi:unnamed protein product [Ilex paraguariensis]|uniref:Uncharacterized protein n=2 Tax=Ilex paraguariensis TaxID=185542 RepID=A0ABC8QNQ5_9AQUA
MDPYSEQRLRDEVIYLHSLWRQGPPRPNPNRRNPNPNTSIHLQPSSSRQFKKERQRPRGKRGGKLVNKPPNSDPPLVSDVEWPCKPPGEAPPETSSGWPKLSPKWTPTTRLPSAEEQARFAANQVHRKALKATQEFLTWAADSDNDTDEDNEMEDDLMGDDGCEEYKFFLNVFKEDGELKSYYEKNYENGEFSCLVCGGVGQKVGKRFMNCVALVQHSKSIAKTKKRRAHRSYGQAICKVLGWDIDRLPSIVMLSAKSEQSQGNADRVGKELNNVDTANADGGEVVKSGESQGNVDNGGKELNSADFLNSNDGEVGKSVQGNADNAGEEINDVDSLNASDGEVFLGKESVLSVNLSNNGEVVLEKESMLSVNLSNNGEVVPEKESMLSVNLSNNGESMVHKNSLPVDDASQCMQALDKGVLNSVEGDAEGVFNGLEPLKDDGTWFL